MTSDRQRPPRATGAEVGSVNGLTSPYPQVRTFRSVRFLRIRVDEWGRAAFSFAVRLSDGSTIEEKAYVKRVYGELVVTAPAQEIAGLQDELRVRTQRMVDAWGAERLFRRWAS